VTWIDVLDELEVVNTGGTSICTEKKGHVRLLDRNVHCGEHPPELDLADIPSAAAVEVLEGWKDVERLRATYERIPSIAALARGSGVLSSLLAAPAAESTSAQKSRYFAERVYPSTTA
jgi:hypothetical protein